MGPQRHPGRQFVRFLDEHLPTEAQAAERSRSTSHNPEWARALQRLQFDHGWLLPGNPPEFGGRNAGILQQFVHREELSHRRIYQCFNPQGVGIVAAEVFFTGVRVPAENLVGPLHGGWKVANGSLGHERTLMWMALVAGGTSEIQRNIIGQRILGLPAR